MDRLTWSSVGKALAAVAMVAAVAGFGTSTAVAEVSQVGGGAFGQQVRGLLSSGPSPSVTLPPGGGGPFTKSQAGVSVPLVLSTGALKVTTKGEDVGTSTGAAQSSAALSGLSIATDVVTVDTLTAQCRSTGAGSLGSASFAGIKVAGVRVDAFAPNTTIEVPGVAQVIINEQVRADVQGSTSITVNALRVTLLEGPAPTEVIVAQARCKATGPDVNGALCPCGLWTPSTVPGTVDAGDPGADVELGVRFRVDQPGVVNAVRFYKSGSNLGPHVGSLWDNAGNLLATVNFVNETTSGWQQANFTPPVPIAADTTYVASYHTTAGHYSFDGGYFAFSGRDQGPLHALADNADGRNGVYKYGPSGPTAFPTQGNGGANYWVDVRFTPSA